MRRGAIQSKFLNGRRGQKRIQLLVCHAGLTLTVGRRGIQRIAESVNAQHGNQGQMTTAHEGATAWYGGQKLSAQLTKQRLFRESRGSESGGDSLAV
jgi:hypothetical protein